MSNETPAGWYRDPGDRAQERFWNGEGWTHDVRQGPEGSVPHAQARERTATHPTQHRPSHSASRSTSRVVLLVAAAVALVATTVIATLFLTGSFEPQPTPVIGDAPPPGDDLSDDDDSEQSQPAPVEDAAPDDDLEQVPEEAPQAPTARPGSRLAELQDAGRVTVGIANEVPFGYVDDGGEVTGIAPDVARSVFSELGVEEVDAVVVEFGDLISSLHAGQFDVISAGMYLTPERARQVHFSDPDYCISESLAVREGNPLGIIDYQSLGRNAAVAVAVAFGTVEELYLQDAGVPDEQVEVFGDIDVMYRALEAGEVDVVTGTAATVEAQVATRGGMEAVEPFFPLDAEGEEIYPCGAHAFADEELRDAFNDVLVRLKADGSTAAIIMGYGEFSAADVELANGLTRDDVLRR